MRSFSVAAPATSANLGPGFDSFALALDLWTTVTVEVDGGAGIRSEGDLDLLGGDDLVAVGMRGAARRRQGELPGCRVSTVSTIPIARGLGSSAAAIVCGVIAAGELLDCSYAPADVIDVAGSIEGHADNVAASVLGGVTVAVQTDTGFVAEVLANRMPWQPVLFIPDEAGYTTEARGVLPDRIPMADAVANLSRSALLVHALQQGREDLVRIAMQDRLHQPYRAAMFPHLVQAIEAAQLAGALGSCLSGAGPTILALARPEDAQRVGAALSSASAECGVAGRALTAELVADGSSLTRR